MSFIKEADMLYVESISKHSGELKKYIQVGVLVCDHYGYFCSFPRALLPIILFEDAFMDSL